MTVPSRRAAIALELSTRPSSHAGEATPARGSILRQLRLPSGGNAVAYPFVKSPNFTPATSRSIGVVVVHTMEIAERKDAAEICARWFASRVSRVSAHYCVDVDTVLQCVHEKDIAWHARGGNTGSIGVELAGFARQTAARWEDAYSSAVLGRASVLVADICRRRRIPVRWLAADDLVAGRRGITGHVEVSRAYRKSDHWDPGPGFPIERFLGLVRTARER
jgi:N-acetyl-anhydromuramyl-L-alanine amidase AmpD